MGSDAKQLAIIGGGAAGLAAAIAAGERARKLGAALDVTVYERDDRVGRSILATGNGRCNLMNLNAPVYYGDTEFANAVLGSGPVNELTEFWNSLGLRLRYSLPY